MKLARAQLSWILYDMANAAFALIVRTVFAPIFFKNYAAENLAPAVATSYWGFVSSAAGIAAGFSPPGSAPSPTPTPAAKNISAFS